MCKSDIFVIAFLLLTTGFGMYMGIFKSLVKMLSTAISLIVSLVLYPMVAVILRKTDIFTALKDMVIDKLELKDMVYEATRQGERQLVESLPLPGNIIEKLTENNNSTVYSILGADNIVDYIGGFIANILLNIGTMIFVFIATFVILRILLTMVGILQKIPGIRTFSRVGGGIAGFCSGILILWIAFLCMNAFAANSFFYNVILDINNSQFAKILYDNNIIQIYFYDKGFI